MRHDIEKIKNNPKLEGQIGENAIWEGPLSKEGFPMGVGSSSGITGKQILKAKSYYKGMPITECAKGYK